MTSPIEITVRRGRNNTYSCRMGNTRASSTNSAQVAVERLMDKLWPPGTHRATQTAHGGDTTHFHITPIT